MKLTLAIPLLALVAGAAQLTLVSVDDEIRMGREAHQQVRKEVPRVTDGEVASYVRGIGRRLAARAQGEKRKFQARKGARIEPGK